MQLYAGSIRLPVLAAVLLALAACAPDPAKVQQEVQAMEPQARAAAQERAQTDLNCGAIKTDVLSVDDKDLGNAYALNRIVYRVQTTGCGQRTTYSVACNKSVCSAMSDGSMIERVK